MFIVSSRRTVAKRPGGGIPGPVLAALSAPGRPRPSSRTPAAGNGAAWNERGHGGSLTGGSLALLAETRAVGRRGPRPRTRCLVRIGPLRPRPSAQVPVAGQSPVPDRLPRRPPPPAARPRRTSALTQACCGHPAPPHAAGLSRPLSRYFSSPYLILDD